MNRNTRKFPRYVPTEEWVQQQEEYADTEGHNYTQEQMEQDYHVASQNFAPRDEHIPQPKVDWQIFKMNHQRYAASFSTDIIATSRKYRPNALDFLDVAVADTLKGMEKSLRGTRLRLHSVTFEQIIFYDDQKPYEHYVSLIGFVIAEPIKGLLDFLPAFMRR